MVLDDFSNATATFYVEEADGWHVGDHEDVDARYQTRNVQDAGFAPEVGGDAVGSVETLYAPIVVFDDHEPGDRVSVSFGNRSLERRIEMIHPKVMGAPAPDGSIGADLDHAEMVLVDYGDEPL